MGSKRYDLREVLKEFRDGENPEKLSKKEMAFCGTRSFEGGCQKLRMVFPHISVVSKPPQLPYGAKKNLVSVPVCHRIFYRNPLGFGGIPL